MVKTRYGKTTKGQNMEVFVAGECAYTTKSTYAAFVAALDTIADGEIGVFADTGALKTSTLSGGDKFFIAQKVTGSKGSASVKKSNIYTYPTSGNLDGTVLGSPYSAPVKPIVYVGWNGTTGSLNAPTIAANQDYQISLVDTTPPAANPLNTLQANRTTATASETIYSILGDPQTGIVAQINNTQTVKSFFSPIQNLPTIYVADIVGNSASFTATSTATGTATLTKGSQTISFATARPGATWNSAVGDFVAINTGAAATAANSILYKIISQTAATIVLDRPYTGVSTTITQTNVQAGYIAKAAAPSDTSQYGVKITTADYFTTFRAVVGPTSFAAATITYATNWALGIGTPEETIEEELEGTVFHSGSSTANAAFAADYGQPTTYAKINRAYATIKVTNTPSERSVAAPVNEYSKAVTLVVKSAYAGTTFTIGGTAQSSGFSAISNPQTGLSAASASALVTTSNDGLAYILGVANIN